MSQHSKKDESMPLVRLEMEGDVTFPVCATCTALYIGELSTTKDIMDNVGIMVKNAERDGQSVVVLKLPEIEFRPLRPAITIGQSVYDREVTAFYSDGEGNRIPYAIFLDPPRPVCWVHIQGFKPQRNQGISGVSQEPASAFIRGKSSGKGM